MGQGIWESAVGLVTRQNQYNCCDGVQTTVMIFSPSIVYKQKWSPFAKFGQVRQSPKQYQLSIQSTSVQEEMGCQESMISQEPPPLLTRPDSCISEEDKKWSLKMCIDRQRGDIFQLYHFSRVVSRGSGIIRQVMDRSSRLQRICKIKTTNKQMQLIRAYQEVQILKHLNHPNIVQIEEYFNQNSFLYIIQQAIPGKSICDLLCQEHFLTLQALIEIIKQILIALSFCHQNGYAHKAINPEHVMVVKLEKQHSLLIKLVGFGNAHKIGAPIISSPLGQTTIFSPPEAYNQQEADKQDIWGCGAIFLQLLSGKRNFPDFVEHRHEIAQEVLSRKNLSVENREIVMDFISQMLQVSPKKRMSAQQALKHEIFKMGGHQIKQKENNAQVLERLLHYRVQMNLRSLFAMYASLNILSVEEKSENLIQFYNLDKNKDGKIDFNQLVESIQNTFNVDHQTAEQNVTKIFAASNRSHENCLQFHEYVAATSFMHKEVCEKTLRRIFDELDSNKNNVISIEELGRSIEGVNLRTLLNDNGIQEISFGRFKTIMMQLYEQEQLKLQGSDI